MILKILLQILALGGINIFIIQLQRIEYRPNNSTYIQRYCTVICTVENLFAVQVIAHNSQKYTAILHTITFSLHFLVIYIYVWIYENRVKDFAPK